jgi:hypothetical protein
MPTSNASGIHFQIHQIEKWVRPMHTRFPFKYGIASLTHLPHLVITLDLSVNGIRSRGMAADGLPPKWFTKDPHSPYEVDLAEMIAVIEHASRIAAATTSQPCHFSDWWRTLYDEQMRWAQHTQRAPLLASLGISLMERAVLDAICRALQCPLHTLLQGTDLIPDLGIARNSLSGIKPADFLPKNPTSKAFIRHTVGLGDWLFTNEIPASERLQDGLPQSLEDCIRHYQLRYFKVKLSGDLPSDSNRVRTLTRLLQNTAPPDSLITVDGNEAFTDPQAFRAWHEELSADPATRFFWQKVLFIEQPLHRSTCFHPDLPTLLQTWPDAPPLLLDEGDQNLDALPLALQLGYRGVSHKNCKGILKGLANAASIQQQNSSSTAPHWLSGEDLASVGPISVQQDLAMQALLGIQHIERNGHHYFHGLSAWSPTMQEKIRSTQPDLWETASPALTTPALITLAIQQGQICLQSINNAPFGVHITPGDLDPMPTLKGWIQSGGF